MPHAGPTPITATPTLPGRPHGLSAHPAVICQRQRAPKALQRVARVPPPGSVSTRFVTMHTTSNIDRKVHNRPPTSLRWVETRDYCPVKRASLSPAIPTPWSNSFEPVPQTHQPLGPRAPFHRAPASFVPSTPAFPFTPARDRICQIDQFCPR